MVMARAALVGGWRSPLTISTIWSWVDQIVCRFYRRAKRLYEFFRVKPLELMLKVQKPKPVWHRTASHIEPCDVLYGIGSTVGAGLFVVTGRAARDFAGPAVSLSFVFSAIACG